ncbi:hypothetical protein TD95_005087 [Thielaviopsis punctulata]|uniref:Exonuclease domain-containing protein n=1 Tax=Thielaviopsis punctulata TaxID=72032 RepID=A0A0F4ZH43_9PEZI|nr:hypothetical protein TD95_005087 [Thielaviopsis punctulata]
MSLLNLKHIPCPAGSGCTAFKCLFRHDDAAPALPDTPHISTSPLPTNKRAASPSTSCTSLPKSSASASSSSSSLSSFFSSSTVSSTGKKLPPPQKHKRPANPPVPGASLTPSPSAHSKPSSDRPPAPPRPKKGVILTPTKVLVDPIGFSGRLKVIQLIHAEFVRLDDLLRAAHPDRTDLFLSQEEADKMALNVEAAVAAGPTAVYRNIAAGRLSMYKKMKLDAWVKERDTAKNPPKNNASGSSPKVINTGLTPDQEAFIAGLMLTPIKNLAKHGYVSVAPSEIQIAQAEKAVAMSRGWEKCHRCEKRFQVFPTRRIEDGALTSGGSCTHHPGRLYTPESPSNVGGRSRVRVERKYRCCHQAVGDNAGCTTSAHHVFRTTDPPRLAQVLQFVKTPENSTPATDAKVVCFDCEMCYTVYGLELVRLTATAWPSGDNILDVLVRPQGTILDLNSQYSGVYPEHLANAKMWTGFEDPIPAPAPGEKTVVRSGELKIVSSPAAARDLLFSLITPETILIGHGLENDLNITRIIHPKLIDTVLLFPHRAGLPVRHGLKALALAHLNRQIQVDDGSGQGHDSAEDARTAGELVRLKVQEKWQSMKANGWKLVDGKFVAPA